MSADIPAIPARERIVPVSTVFIDGSCFYLPSKRLRSAAAAYHIPNQVDFACDMKHPDVSPQRAEIFALLLACRHFTGPMDVASDCQTVVHGASVLQSPEKNAFLSQCDNQDLWAAVAAELRVDTRVFKVKAHVKPGCRSQSAFLTRGNETVDALAKSKAKQLADIHFAEFSQCLYDAVKLQTHIVSSLIARAEHATNGAFNMFDDSAHVQQPTISVSRPCSCPPLSRCRGKVQACRGICKDNSFPSFRLAGLEEQYCQDCVTGRISFSLFQQLQNQYCAFANRFAIVVAPTNHFHHLTLENSGLLRKSHVRTRKPSCSISKPRKSNFQSKRMVKVFLGCSCF